jgi:hypothetical protein
MRIFDLLVCLSLLIVAGFVVRLDVQDFRRLQRTAHVSTLPNTPIPLRFITGYDAHSHPISALPSGFKRFVIFVIHGSHFKEDVDFWNRVKEENADSTTEFVGVCDDANCIKSLTVEQGKLHFSSVVFGDYFALRRLLATAAQGHMVVLTRDTGAIRTVDYPKSLAEVVQLRAALAEGP